MLGNLEKNIYYFRAASIYYYSTNKQDWDFDYFIYKYCANAIISHTNILMTANLT